MVFKKYLLVERQESIQWSMHLHNSKNNYVFSDEI